MTTDNSLNSWTNRGSIDSSLASRYAAIHLEEEIAALQRQALIRKKRLARQVRVLKRVAVLIAMASVGYYFWDPNGYGAASTRTNISEGPLGLMGGFQFVLAFVCCLKLQRFFQTPVVPINQSRCPALQWMSQVYESRVAETNSQHQNVVVGNLA